MERVDCTNLSSNYTLFLWGDIHEGAGEDMVDYSAIEKCKRLLKAGKNRYLVLGGDLIETIAPHDKRYNIIAHRQRIDMQMKNIIDLFNPVADKILWVLCGNHEYKMLNIMDISAEIAKAWDTSYGGFMCRAFMPTFKIFDWHSTIRVNPKAGDHRQIKTNREITIKRALRNKAGDCLVMALHHVHQLIVHPPDYHKIEIMDDGKRLSEFYARDISFNMCGNVFIPEDYRWYLACGSAKKLFASPSSRGEKLIPWEETVDLCPAEIGCIKLCVKNDRLVSVGEEYLGGK